jgi:hypothetical protein
MNRVAVIEMIHRKGAKNAKDFCVFPLYPLRPFGNCSCVACRDAGEGREQDAVALLSALASCFALPTPSLDSYLLHPCSRASLR